jgi:hypothetical protein
MADELTQWRVAAETKEWIGPITVLADGVPTIDFQVTLTGPGERPAVWAAPTVLDGGRGMMIGTGTDFTLVPGRKYTAWIRLADDPEDVVSSVGIIRVY